MSGRTRALAAMVVCTAVVATGCSFADTAGNQNATSTQPPATAAADEVSREVRDMVRAATVRVRNVTCDGLGRGSGFVLDTGQVVSNRHVVVGARRVELSTWDGAVLPVEVTAAAQLDDLAVLDPATPPTDGLFLGADPEPGDAVALAGFPGGGSFEFQQGSVLGFSDTEQGRAMMLSIPVEKGNSGGPVVDVGGAVVGVVFAFDSTTGHALAVPVSTLSELMGDAAAFDPVTAECG